MKSIGITIYYAYYTKMNLFENKNFDNCFAEVIFVSKRYVESDYLIKNFYY